MMNTVLGVSRVVDLPGPDLEELLPDIQHCVARSNAGRLEAIRAATEGGQLLNMARGKLLHGDWLPYLEKAGLNRMTANRWMRLADLELAPEVVLERGGIRAVLARWRPPLPFPPCFAQALTNRRSQTTRKSYPTAGRTLCSRGALGNTQHPETAVNRARASRPQRRAQHCPIHRRRR